MYKKKPFFITFEGIEGSGKSHHSKKLFRILKKNKLSVIYTREPGGTRNGETIRKIILNSKNNYFDKYTELFLYFAARNELIHKVLIPSLKKRLHSLGWGPALQTLPPRIIQPCFDGF